MKWLVAPNAFKGTIDAEKAAAIVQKAILYGSPQDEVELCPIADGGDGTCYLLSQAMGLEKVDAIVMDSLGRPVRGFFSYDPNSRTAYLDVSTVSGVKLLKEYEKDPWTCSTFGTGELVLKAIEKGAEEIVIGLGGSATVDLGTGILRALGIVFLDEKGREIPMFSPGFLEKISHIQQTPNSFSAHFTFLCDVNNTFFGENGAVPVFGPQKGLKPEDQERFLLASKKLYGLYKKKSSTPLDDRQCFGAAGGIALGISAFFPTRLEPGARYFFEMVNISGKIKAADLIITGEGKYDSQSAQGKGSFELLKLARKEGKKVILITSGTEGKESGFDEVLQLPDLDFNGPDVSLTAEKNLFEAVVQFMENSKDNN